MTWVAAGTASAAATFAGIKYAKGRYDAKQDAKNRPKYEIPEEIKQNLTQAQQQALEGLPEEQKQQFLDNIQRSTAYGLTQQSSRQGGLAGISQINQNQNNAYGNLLSADSQARRENQGVLMGQRQNMADYRDQGFQFNKVNPYYEQIARKEADTGALFQNLDNSMTMGVSAFGNTKSMQQQPKNNSFQNNNTFSAPPVNTWQMDSNQNSGQPIVSQNPYTGQSVNVNNGSNYNPWY